MGIIGHQCGAGLRVRLQELLHRRVVGLLQLFCAPRARIDDAVGQRVVAQLAGKRLR
ncbi:hypothetical protein [Xanthomonas vasicola]|uniref:hypothetical protein n=1 Tax=Xanthomonas vasicola TaxID=56459 RepID=UPI001D0C13BB|nr:hypothetical protein [Xanthomonas vasicola]